MRLIERFPNYGFYADGRVQRITPTRNSGAGRFLSTNVDKDGYLALSLCNDGRILRQRVNRLICEAYHGPPPSGAHHAAHNDGDKKNNCESNLRWALPKQNNDDRYAHGTMQRGEAVYNAKLTEEAVLDIRSASPYRGLIHDLASKYNVSEATIKSARCRTHGTWRHVEFP